MKSRHALLLAGALLAAGCGDLAARSPGERIWRARCADCHGVDGAGNTPRFMGDPYADLIDGVWKNAGADRGSLESAIREGSFPDMPAFDDLTPQEMRALLDHIATLRGEQP